MKKIIEMLHMLICTTETKKKNQKKKKRVKVKHG